MTEIKLETSALLSVRIFQDMQASKEEGVMKVSQVTVMTVKFLGIPLFHRNIVVQEQTPAQENCQSEKSIGFHIEANTQQWREEE